MISKETLEHWKKLCDEATPGAWKPCHHLKPGGDESCPCKFPGDIWGSDGNHVVCTMGPHLFESDLVGPVPPRYERKQELANSAFITESRTALPHLIEAYEKLKLERDAAVEDLSKINRIVGAIPFSDQDKWGGTLETVWGISSKYKEASAVLTMIERGEKK